MCVRHKLLNKVELGTLLSDVVVVNNLELVLLSNNVGDTCPDTIETQGCNEVVCPPPPCRTDPWGAWGPCSDAKTSKGLPCGVGIKIRTRKVADDCPAKEHHTLDCVLNEQGEMGRVRYITKQPLHDGNKCPATRVQAF